MSTSAATSIDLKSIDLHLLSCFDALIAEQSVTRAAVRMELSQPAMSHALARMRVLFHDELLVRTSRGMSPTPRARELHQLVQQVLQAFSVVLAEAREFDPASGSARLTLAVTDYTCSMVLPQLASLVRREAPQMELIFVPSDRTRVQEWLEEGEVDLTIGYFVELPEGLHATELYSDSMCCIVSRTHGEIQGAIDLGSYAAKPHVYWGGAKSNLFTLEMMTDRALAELGIARKIQMRVPSAFGVAQVAASSDLLATVPRSGALDYQLTLGVQVLDLPFAVSRPNISLVWHERTHRNPAARWLREAIRRCGAWPRNDGTRPA